MKHPISTTAILIFLFIATQVIGLSLLSLDMKDIVKNDAGIITIVHNPTVIGDRPQTTGGGSFLYIALGVAIGTALMLLIIRFKLFSFWKGWFFFAVWLSTSVAFGVFLPSIIAFVMGFGLAAWKVFYPNPWVHNFTEIFMYAGIALIIVPIFTLWWMIALLGLISIYDMIAVWYSKHMVTMAEAQREQKMFAGLYVPKKVEGKIEQKVELKAETKKSSIKVVTTKSSSAKQINNKPAAPVAPVKSGSAILGGGDLAFPLIFSGVAMEWLIINGTPRITALYLSLFITLGATVSLALLFIFAKKDRYYPAMPFLSAGCLLGFALMWLIKMI